MNPTFTVTKRGIDALSDTSSNLDSLQIHVLAVCISEPKTIRDIVNAIKTKNITHKFLDPRYVVVAVNKLLDVHYLNENVPQTNHSVNHSTKFSKRGR